jgi:hypothetical protein
MYSIEIKLIEHARDEMKDVSQQAVRFELSSVEGTT